MEQNIIKIMKSLYWYLPNGFRKYTFRYTNPNRYKEYQNKFRGIGIISISFENFMRYKLNIVHTLKVSDILIN